MAAAACASAAVQLLLQLLLLLLEALALLLLGCGEEGTAEGASLVLFCYLLLALAAQPVLAALEVLEDGLCEGMRGRKRHTAGTCSCIDVCVGVSQLPH